MIVKNRPIRVNISEGFLKINTKSVHISYCHLHAHAILCPPFYTSRKNLSLASLAGLDGSH